MSDTGWYSDLIDRENDGVPEPRPNAALHAHIAAHGSILNFPRTRRPSNIMAVINEIAKGWKQPMKDAAE